MTEQVTLRKLLQADLDEHPTFSGTTIADRVLKGLGVGAKPRMLLLPDIGNVVENLRRTEVRTVERAVFGGSRRKVMGEVVDALAERKSLMDMTFKLGDGRSVMHGDATVQDHRDRIEYLLGFRRGLDATIARHEEAIRMIEAHKVTCLRDIPQEDAA